VVECSADPNWQCLSDSNNVIAVTKGQNKCVCLNILRLQFQSPPHEKSNNGEGGKFKKRGLFQINKHGFILNRAATEQPDWFSEHWEERLCRLSSSSSFSSSSPAPKPTDVVNTNNLIGLDNYNLALCSISLSHLLSPLCSPPLCSPRWTERGRESRWGVRAPPPFLCYCLMSLKIQLHCSGCEGSLQAVV